MLYIYIYIAKDFSSVESVYRVLHFYKTYHNNFPTLSNIARIFFSIPITSVPSESLFSQSGLIQTDLRNRLKPENLDKYSFLKYNLNLF